MILVGYDGSGAALSALRWAIAQTPPLEDIVVVSSQDGATARARLDALWMEDAGVLDEEVELIVDDRPPGEALVRIAEDRDARMIVVGHQRRGRLGVLHNSVARDLLEHSPVPVCVVP